MSPARLAVPPGRAGRLWLERRLAVAGRAADLLDRKLHILDGELSRLRAEAERTGREWNRLCGEAEARLLQAVLVGGEQAVQSAGPARAAEVTVCYAATMGARHPTGARCVMEPPDDWEGAAVAQAREAHQAALAAAVAHAAAAGAVEVVAREATTTRYRLRAVRDRWIPRLEEALAQATFALEEIERADAARLRRAFPRR